MNLALLELRETALALVKEFHFELRDEDMRDPASECGGDKVHSQAEEEASGASRFQEGASKAS